MNNRVDSIAEQTEAFVQNLHNQIEKQVKADIAQKLAQIDIHKTVYDYINYRLIELLKVNHFPEGSIPGSAIDISSLRIHGDNIFAGTIKGFNSTGIQDTATSCQVTILDSATVVENRLIASTVEIKGDLVVDGNLHLLGEIPSDSPFYKDLVEHSAGMLKLSLNEQFFKQYSDTVFASIKEQGVDLTKLTLNGVEILSGNKLSYAVTDTNIQKVGELRSLTVNGEADLTGTLFARNGRIGINTEEPSATFTVWDDECEVVIKKLKKNTAIVGSTRDQTTVILSSNGQDNVVLNPDGTTAIDKLSVGNVQLRSGVSCPKSDAKKGTVVFNENPELGSPVGWVSLGGSRWATFGLIQ